MFDIIGIKNPNKEYPDHTNIQFESLQDYRLIAIKLIKFIAPMYGRKMCNALLRDEDAVTHVMNEVIKADWLWNGTGIREGYRKQRALWAIQKLVKKSCDSTHIQSLDWEMDNGEDEKTPFYATLTDGKQSDPVKVIEEQEEFENVLRVVESTVLNNSQRDCIKLRFLEELTYEEIGKRKQMSTEGARQAIKTGLQKLKRELT